MRARELFEQKIEIPAGKSRRVTVPVPRYWYHSLRGRSLGAQGEIPAYNYGRETDMFRDELYRDPKPEGFVYLSPRPFTSNAIKIDISKLDTSLMRLTGQVEGYAVYGADIPSDAQVSDH